MLSPTVSPVKIANHINEGGLFIRTVPTLFMMVVLLLSKIVHAEIVEIKKMAEIIHRLTEGTLVVFDIDNTIIRPNQTLGSDQWFDFLVKVYQDAGVSEANAIDQAIQSWAEHPGIGSRQTKSFKYREDFC